MNETIRTSFEVMARNVFRKYKALFPQEEAKKYSKDVNAIQAIYDLLNQKVKSADITEIIMELQAIVSDSVTLEGVEEPQKDVYIDLSTLNFDKLKKAFEK